jgi:hypothetical protein
VPKLLGHWPGLWHAAMPRAAHLRTFDAVSVSVLLHYVGPVQPSAHSQAVRLALSLTIGHGDVMLLYTPVRAWRVACSAVQWRACAAHCACDK